jgi:hypothetical protein
METELPSLATAAMIGWEWLQREVDIFATFEVSHLQAEGAPERRSRHARKDRRKELDPAF